DVPAPRAKVWDEFLDPRQLKKAIPGCEKLEALGNDEFKATMKIGVAAVKGTFEGKVRLADKKPPESYRLLAEGSGGPGFVKADTLITLTETDGGTRVSYSADVQVDGLKENQAANPPWGDVLAVPLADVLRVHMTSATTGRPLAFLDTREDWYGFYHSYARSLYAYGVRKHDMVMAAFSYGPWIGYWSGFYAAQDLGCLVFPVGGLTTDARIDALLSYPITVLGCTPSYALFLAEVAAKKGIDLAKQTKVRITWHTGEPGASIPATKAKIEAAFGAKAFDLPGLTEIAAWGFECDARAGLVHVHEDYCYPEVLDDADLPVGAGGRGELGFTS